MSNAVWFDATTAYINAGNSNTLDFTTLMSIGAWIKPRTKQSSAGRFPIMYRGTGGVGGWGFASYYNRTGDGKFSISFTRTSVVDHDSTVEIIPDRINYVAVTFNGAGNLRFFRDGAMLQTMVSGGNIISVPGVTAYIASPTGGLPATLYGVHAYNRQLTDEEILYNYFHPNNPKRQGLQLNLTQDSIYGPQWNDLSGNANNGTYVGGAVPVSSNRLAGR